VLLHTTSHARVLARFSRFPKQPTAPQRSAHLEPCWPSCWRGPAWLEERSHVGAADANSAPSLARQIPCRLTGVEDLKGHVVADTLVIPGTAVAEAGVVAAAPLEGQLHRQAGGLATETRHRAARRWTVRNVPSAARLAELRWDLGRSQPPPATLRRMVNRHTMGAARTRAPAAAAGAGIACPLRHIPQRPLGQPAGPAGTVPLTPRAGKPHVETGQHCAF
jgi:hypothetical protein